VAEPSSAVGDRRPADKAQRRRKCPEENGIKALRRRAICNRLIVHGPSAVEAALLAENARGVFVPLVDLVLPASGDGT